MYSSRLWKTTCESTNPIVTVMELFTMKADHLNAQINEKLNEVNFTVIADIKEYFGMME
jgi:hypothetical protein